MFTREKKPSRNSSKTSKNKKLFVQPKLSFGKAGDTYEVEADKMADKVVNKPAEPNKVQKKEGEEDVQAKPLATEVTPLIQRMESTEEEPVQKMEEEEAVQSKEEEEPIQKMEEEEAVQSKDEEEIQAKKESIGNKTSIEGKLRKGSGGSKMDANTKSEMETGFGADFSGVKIHNDTEAANMSSNIGAQAFTHGNDIYFNKGKYSPNSTEGKHLLAHELTHTIQQKGMVQKKIQLREAKLLERRSWLSFFDHYLPRKFLNNYMDDTGKEIKLTSQEMKDCNPIINIFESSKIIAEKARLKKGEIAEIKKGTVLAAALTSGTLGNFTINFEGKLKANADGTYSFQGTMSFYDFWNFDPKIFKKSGRSLMGELKTVTGYLFLPGTPFKINSNTVKVSQVSGSSAANWGNNFKPVSIIGPYLRTALDIYAATVPTLPMSPLLGLDIGTQVSEDFNKKKK